jgi:hypothetical protein
MSLKYRIAATIFALEVIVIGTVLWITLSHSMRAVREQIARTEDVTLQLLADLSRAALLTEEYADLRTFIEGATRDPRVITIVVGSSEGRVVAATEPELIGGSFPELAVSAATIATGARPPSAVAPAFSARWRSSSPITLWRWPTGIPATLVSALPSSACWRSRSSARLWGSS